MLIEACRRPEVGYWRGTSESCCGCARETFAVGVDVTTEFRRCGVRGRRARLADAVPQGGEHRVDTGQWMDVNFVPNWIGHSKNMP